MSRSPLYWLLPEKNTEISKIAPRELVRVTSFYNFKTWYFNYIVLWTVLSKARLEGCALLLCHVDNALGNSHSVAYRVPGTPLS